jgi:hypothetical protein
MISVTLLHMDDANSDLRALNCKENLLADVITGIHLREVKSSHLLETSLFTNLLTILLMPSMNSVNQDFTTVLMAVKISTRLQKEASLKNVPLMKTVMVNSIKLRELAHALSQILLDVDSVLVLMVRLMIN